MSGFVDVHSYLGKSSYASDPNVVATVDEFRIYNGVMNSMQVEADYAAGPDVLPGNPPAIAIIHTGNNVVLSWSAGAIGCNLQTTATLGAGAAWDTLPGGPTAILTNGTYQIIFPAANQTALYRLSN
jgi:hypothetical protein